MTEQIPSGSHRQPSSPEVDVALLKERYREIRKDYENIMDRLDVMIGKISKIETIVALSEHDMKAFAQRLSETDTDVSLLRASVDGDKRSPVAIVLATLATLAAGATAWLK